MQIIATDPDFGLNSKLSYTIKKGNEGGLFRMENRTGVITLEQPLGKDLVGTYTLLVAVQDSGIPSQTTWSNLVVIVASDDRNSNLIIAIAVGAVTATLSAAMVIIIFVIRRQDAQKSKQNQDQIREHKKWFIVQWLACLSTSNKQLHKIGSDRVEQTRPAYSRPDTTPIITRSHDSTSSDGSHDNQKVS